MREVVAVILWAWIPVLWQPLWGQAPGVRVQATDNQKQKAALRAPDPSNPEIGTEARPAIVELKDRPKSKDEAAEDRRKNNTKEYRDAGTFYAAVSSAVISGILLLIGSLGVWAAVRTLEAIEKQVRLMQAQFDQWVELENWNTTRPASGRFVVEVDLVNHTAYPVTLDEGELTLTGNVGPKGATFYLGTRTFLPPNQPHRIDFDIGRGMLPEQLASLESVSFTVKGTFSHPHRITKEEIRQPLEGILWCGPWKSDGKWHADYAALVHMNPELAQRERGEQKEN